MSMSQLMLYQALINRTTLRGAPRTGLDFSLLDRYTTWNPGPGKALPRTCHPRPPQACTVGYPAIGGADRARTRSQELKRVSSLTGVESEVTSVAVIHLAANPLYPYASFGLCDPDDRSPILYRNKPVFL